MILVDGEPAESIPVTDSVVLRGDGVFEALRTSDGRPFALEEHLARLDKSARALHLETPNLSDLSKWVTRVARPVGDGIVRILVTRGDADTEQRVVVLSTPVPDVPDPFRVKPHPAPWHPAGREWELAGVKTLSYAPNLAASRQAHLAGFDDALLVSDEGIILEGPTFCIGWFRDGRFETPSIDLGILASITRAQTLDVVRSLGFEVVEGRFDVATLHNATDVVALSTVKQVTPVEVCGDLKPPITGLTAQLRQAFAGYFAAALEGF